MPSNIRDAWCATFVSFIAILLGYTDIIPTECGCEQQINLFKQKGRWQEDGTVKPQIADVIYYNWMMEHSQTTGTQTMWDMWPK